MCIFTCLLPSWPEGAPREGGRVKGKPLPQEWSKDDDQRVDGFFYGFRSFRMGIWPPFGVQFCVIFMFWGFRLDFGFSGRLILDYDVGF